eukprot:m51a1_g123 putative serine hydroxymethyltransferase (469) ;mRNA; f:416245-418106
MAADPRESTFLPNAKSLAEADPELHEIIVKEEKRQRRGLEMIASENFCSRAVREANGTRLTDKYAEGYPGARYYGGNHFIDESERLCQKRALQAYRLNPEEWGVNVQPLSGSPANLAVYTALLQPHDRIMGLDLPHGGHLTHGYMTAKKRVSATSVFWESMPYHVSAETGRIDYDEMEKLASFFRPKLLICGASAYPREFEFQRFRKAADAVGALLMCDMAHIGGLVAAQEHTSPFDFCDVVTTTTHKTLRGPRSGIIFFRKGVRSVDAKTGKPIMWDLEERINSAVFPGLQGGPHEHTIAGVSTALREAMTPEFKAYAHQIKLNCRRMAEVLMAHGYDLVTGGTDNHLILVDLRSKNIDGARAERVLDRAGITVNKNSVPGDLRPFVPGGLRIGTPALTTRGLNEADFTKVAEFIHRAIVIALEFNKNPEVQKSLQKFYEQLDANMPEELRQLNKEVEEFALSFPMP